jgi:hypothetical protein
LLVQ